MIELKTKDGTLKLDGIEDLLKLSNKQRMELFGKYYSNKIVKNYGKLDEVSLINGLILMLSDTLRYRANIKAVLSELKDSWYFRELTDGDTITVSDVIPAERKLQSQKSVIEKRKYAHSHEWLNEKAFSPNDDELDWELYRLCSSSNIKNVVEELNKKYRMQKDKEESNK
jgi:hypothetical protein